MKVGGRQESRRAREGEGGKVEGEYRRKGDGRKVRE